MIAALLSRMSSGGIRVKRLSPRFLERRIHGERVHLELGRDEMVPFKDEPAAGHRLLGGHEIGRGQHTEIHMPSHEQSRSILSAIYVLGVVFIWFCPETTGLSERR